MPPLPVLDLDDPEVLVELELAGEIEVRLRHRRPARPETTHKTPLRLAALGAARRRAVKRDAAVERIDANEDCAGRLIAAPHDHDGNALGLAEAQIGSDEDLALDPHRSAARSAQRSASLLVSRPVSRSSSSKSSAVIVPVSVTLRSRWKPVMAFVGAR